MHPTSRSLPLFFAGAFLFTWLLQAPALLAKLGYIQADPVALLPLALLGVLGPAASATAVSAWEGGPAAVRRLFASMTAGRAPIWLYGVALLVPGVLLTAVLWLLRLAGREGPIAYVPDAAHFVVAFVVAFGEELGWRGFALPRLQARLAPFAASGLIGVLWTLWHIPMFVAVGIPLSLLLVMTLYFTGGSLFFTWLFNRSRGSVLLMICAHVGAHLNNSHAALPGDRLPLVVNAVVYALLGFVLMRQSLSLSPPLEKSGSRWIRRSF